MGGKAKQFVINTETGELLNEINEGDRISITRESSLKHLAKELGLVEFLPNARFVKLYTDPLHTLKKCLSGSEVMFLICILDFISYETGILQHSNGKVLNRKAISEITESDVKTVDRIVASLVKKEVLGKHKTGRYVCYTVNPYLFCRGKKVSKTLIKLYERSKWASLIK